MLSYTDTRPAREVKGPVARRGLCGDVYLVGTPAGAADRRREGRHLGAQAARSTFDAAARGAGRGRAVRAARRDHATAADRSREFTEPGRSRPPTSQDGRVRVHRQVEARPALGPPHAGEPRTTLQRLARSTPAGRCSTPAGPTRFGFREFWIDGRDFYLNGTPHLPLRRPARQRPDRRRARPATPAPGRRSSGSRASASTSSTRTTTAASRARTSSFAEILRAADDVGMLVALSQPHFATTTGRRPTPTRTTATPAHAEFYVARRREPSVGRLLRHEPQRDRLRRGHEPRPDRRPPATRATPGPRTTPKLRPAGRGDRAAARPGPHRLPPRRRATSARCTRCNFYPNFAPIQELSDWFEHWATKGVKPLFTVRVRRAVHLGLDDVPRLVQGQARVRQRRRALGVLPGRVERAVPRRPRLSRSATPEKANLRWEAKQFRGRQALAPLGLPDRGRLAAVRRPATRCSPRYLDRQLAGLPHLGRLGDLAVGVRGTSGSPRPASTAAARS